VREIAEELGGVVDLSVKLFAGQKINGCQGPGKKKKSDNENRYESYYVVLLLFLTLIASAGIVLYTDSTMGELFRSEEMTLVQLFVQIEAAHDTVDELGQLGLIQFRDVRIFNIICDKLSLFRVFLAILWLNYLFI